MYAYDEVPGELSMRGIWRHVSTALY